MKLQTTIKSIVIAGVVSLSLLAPAHAQEWTLTSQTHVGFNIRSIDFSVVKGKFEQVQSSMSFDPEEPQNASAQFVLDINSLILSKPSLKNMILSEDLFYAKKYPTAMFKSHEFIVLGNHHYSIKGDLTLRGITQPVTLHTVLKPNPANPKLLDVESKAVVNRSDFGMKKAFGGIGGKVNIELDGQWKLR
ncbi:MULTISPECIES: YceI family protein [unclassified Acinetobacter]|uniref:YceI family protein n=1 Tax=unclassified Acinetobacter TaxID=196816 RepID=UPI001C232A6C|nr:MULTISPECIES: YceI family protein [unclassified Acinetobacter]